MVSKAHQILIRKLKEHSRLTGEDVALINSFGHTIRQLNSSEDLVRQGDAPGSSAVVLSGMVARYHLLQNGRRQYLSFHMAVDMPDSQALFIDTMDHAVCAVGPAVVALVPHKELMAAFARRPTVAFAIWRETLIDAAIFREAITNNSARPVTTRMAHLFCELFYRARASGLTEGDTFSAPITLVQLGETLAMAIATVNRTILELRSSQAVDFHRGEVHVKDWDRMVEIGEFNPSYLHLKRPT